MRIPRLLVASQLILASATLIPRASAQTSTGAISITVLDPSGAIVPGADVVVTGSDTGNTLRSFKTNDRGITPVPLIPPGAYDVTISASGFKRVVRKSVVVDAGQTADLQSTLETGSASESVTVR